jgi:hypothetical protein
MKNVTTVAELHPGPASESSNLSRTTSMIINNFFVLYKQQMQSQASTTMMMGPNPTAMLYGHHQQPQQHQVHNLQSFGPSGLDFTPAKPASEACIRRTMSAPVVAPWSCLDAFADNLSQLSSEWEGELQSVVHTGFLQGKPNAWLPQELHCIILHPSLLFDIP